MLPPGPDDWFGEVAEDDWGGRGATERARSDQGLDGLSDAPVSERGAAQASRRGPTEAAAARHATVGRRRAVAAAALVAAAAARVGLALLVVRGGADEPATTAPEAVGTTPTTTTPAATTPTVTTPTETTPAATTPTDTTPTTPSAPGASSFTLPEGTKLRVDEDVDPAVVTSLQRALQSAGYDPGPIDGTYGPKTVAAVVAFQQANDLDDDGVVGAATAAALNEALAAG